MPNKTHTGRHTYTYTHTYTCVGLVPVWCLDRFPAGFVDYGYPQFDSSTTTPAVAEFSLVDCASDSLPPQPQLFVFGWNVSKRDIAQLILTRYVDGEVAYGLSRYATNVSRGVRIIYISTLILH